MQDVLILLASLGSGLAAIRFAYLWHKRMTLQIEWYEYKNEELDYLARKREPDKYS